MSKQSRNLVPKADEPMKSRVEAGFPGFTAARTSHTLRFGTEIKVHRMQLPILLCGRNGQEFEKIIF